MTRRLTIEPTSPMRVASAAAVGFAGAGVAATWWQGSGGSLPVPGVVSWASVLLITGGIGYLAKITRRAVRDVGAILDPSQALTRLLLGKTSLLAAAFLGGAYAALVVWALPALPAPLALQRVAHGAATCLASVGWAVAGAWLEAACRVPPENGEDADESHGAQER